MANSNEEILLKLKIQTDKANAALKKTEVEIKRTIQSFRGLEKGSIDYQAAQAKLANQQATLAQQTIKYNNALNIQTSAQSNAIKQTHQLKNASGGATTSVLELGRVVSDAPYGIRGMANNVSQLASNMLFTAQQVDKTTGKVKGFGGVLKDMGKVFMGPLGVLFAIQAVIAAVDYFYGSATKAAGAGKDFELSAKDLSGTLRDLHGTQDEVNDKIDEYITLMMKKRAVAKEDAESNQEIAKLDKVIDDAKAIMFNNDVERLGGAKRLTKQQIALANKTYNAQKEILEKAENDRVEEFKNVIKRQQEIEDLDKKMKAAREGTLKSLKDLKKEKERERELNADSAEEYKRLTIAIDEYQKKIEEIEGKKKKGSGKTKKISPFKTPKELDIDIKNADNAIIQYEKKIEDARLKKELNDKLSEAKTEEEKRNIREKYQEEKLRNQIDAERKALELKMSTEKAVVNQKVDNHIDDLKRATELYIHKIKLDKKLSSEQKKQMIGIAKSQLQIATNQAQKEGIDSVKEITEKYNPLFVLFEQLGHARMDALFSGFGDKDEINKFQEFADRFNEISASVTSFMDGEFTRQMTIEQNKTNALNNELRERLNNENLSADERKSIQLKIARNDEALRKKQEQIEKKRFRMNKAASIAGALVNTAAAAAGVMKDAKGGFFARLSQAIPTIAFGLAQVATIARQKFQSSAGATTPAGALGSGGGSGGADRSFNFNLAGASQENQLAQTLQGRFDQPLQAYVVSRDITNQQQLDQDILSNASFG
jgi:myosin heavy subunit